MGRRSLALLAFVAALAGPAAAAVLDRDETGFTASHEGIVALAPADAYARFVAIGGWWSDDHTFSGQAANMTIAAVPGGCWCETLPDGGFVKHLDVAMAAPGAMLVLRGGLGPLLFMGASGTLTVRFEAAGEGTRVTLTYAVGGHDAGKWAEMSVAVDRVLAEQFAAYLGGSAAR